MKTNSASGEICTAVEVCKIIKACKESGVSYLEFNGLKLNFSNPLPEESYHMPQMVADIQEMGDNNTDYVNVTDSAEVLTNNMEEMKIIDPLAYEKFLQEEDVNHA